MMTRSKALQHFEAAGEVAIIAVFHGAQDREKGATNGKVPRH
jgi:hypothetical protein